MQKGRTNKSQMLELLTIGKRDIKLKPCFWDNTFALFISRKH